jgi:lysozyme
MPTGNDLYSIVAPITKEFEGYRDKLYRCTAGKQTIGWGYNIEDRGISTNVAEMMFRECYEEALADCKAIFPGFDLFDECLQVAMIDMRFNMGGRTFRTFKTMIAAVNRGDREAAAQAAKKSKWFTQVGRRGRAVVALIRGE